MQKQFEGRSKLRRGGQRGGGKQKQKRTVRKRLGKLVDLGASGEHFGGKLSAGVEDKGHRGYIWECQGRLFGSRACEAWGRACEDWAGDVSLITNLNYFVSIWMSEIGFKGSQAEAE